MSTFWLSQWLVWRIRLCLSMGLTQKLFRNKLCLVGIIKFAGLLSYDLGFLFGIGI
jgi:hypothetical protein